MQVRQAFYACLVLCNLLLLFLVLQKTDPTALFEEALSEQMSSGVVIDAADFPDLQAALDAVPEGGGLVRLPPKTIEITKPLEVKREDTRLEGAGPVTHIVNRNETGEPALVLRPSQRAASELGRVREGHLWRLQLSGFRISGNPKSGDGVLAIGIDEIYIHNLYVDHNGGNGIRLADCYENPRITDCNITYNGKAGLSMMSSSHNPVISNCHFEENRDGVEAIHIYNICMTGNNFDDQTRHGIIIEDSWGGVLTGNMVEQCRGIGIVLDRDCYGFAITANIIGQNYQGGIDLRDAWGCAVSANAFSITHQRALVIGAGSGRITVTGNNFSDTHVGGRDYRPEGQDPGSGIHLEGTKDISITGNVFAGLREKGIQTTGKCERVVVSSNLTTDLAGAPGLDVGSIGTLVKGLNLDAD